MHVSVVVGTFTGVLLAFAIPFSPKEDDGESPSYRLEHFLHKPVAFVMLPIFALANTGVVIGTGLFGGIGFTMSIFITNLVFVENLEAINASKLLILLASLLAGAIGFLWLKLFGKPNESDKDINTIDFHATEMRAQEDA